MMQLLEACVFLPVSTIFHLVNIHILHYQKQILMTDFFIIRLQTISKAIII